MHVHVDVCTRVPTILCCSCTYVYMYASLCFCKLYCIKAYCILLGYAYGLKNAAFGMGTNPVLNGKLACSGTETSLLQCYRSVDQISCGHSEDIGILCPSMAFPLGTSMICHTLPPPSSPPAPSSFPHNPHTCPSPCRWWLPLSQWSCSAQWREIPQ